MCNGAMLIEAQTPTPGQPDRERDKERDPEEAPDTPPTEPPPVPVDDPEPGRGPSGPYVVSAR
jgi:hypothetical protein